MRKRASSYRARTLHRTSFEVNSVLRQLVLKAFFFFMGKSVTRISIYWLTEDLIARDKHPS